MLRLFSAPILLGIILGTIFPYQSQTLIWLSSILLFLLLFLNTLRLGERKIISSVQETARPLLVSLILLYVFFPVIQTAAMGIFLSDLDWKLGAAVSALAPSALVIPFFASQLAGNARLAITNIVASTVVCPVILIPMLSLMGLRTVFLDVRGLSLLLFVLTILPFCLSWLCFKFWPSLARTLESRQTIANSLLLALLMFILVGSSIDRVPLRSLPLQDLAILVGLYIWMDFGVYYLCRYFGAWFFAKSIAETLALSVGMRNYAVTAGLLLVFHPRAALPSAIGLIVHAVFFQWLLLKKTDDKTPSSVRP